ncbi:MAG: Hsp70 family protein [Planctomycetaceae bacterium]
MPPLTHSVGIDLGTTYSCISYLNPQGQPITLPNEEGELTTPSVVLIDGSDVIVGTEALRNAVSHPDRVIQHAKRYMGDTQKSWTVDGQRYTPVDVSAFVIRKLLDGAESRLGPIKQAVITVPAQFSDIQRQWTSEAGRLAGLERVDIINEPVAAALCHVLGEGNWFAEIANDQTVMVFDLGGGTFDLSLVRYNKDKVTVVASGGDLNLGGLDWNKALENFACDAFARESAHDPRYDSETMQSVALEIEQTKRSLSVRPRAAISLTHAGRRKVIGIDREEFEKLTAPLVKRCEEITLGLLKTQKIGWARVDAVLITGGATRMPMIRSMLKRISGTTLNSTLSPDQSISHGAAYYAGMILSGDKFASSFLNRQATARLGRFKQQSVNARELGILVRDPQTEHRVPHYLIPANTALPCAYKQSFGTVSSNQRRVHLHIVESGTSGDQPFVELGACIVEDLPPNLPVNTPIEVTIRYDEQARVHVSARELASGKAARVSIIRPENVISQTLPDLPPPQSAPTAVEIPAKLRGPKDKAKAKPVASVFQPAHSVPPAGTPVKDRVPTKNDPSRTAPAKQVVVKRSTPAPSEVEISDVIQTPSPSSASRRPAAPPSPPVKSGRAIPAATVSKPLSPAKPIPSSKPPTKTTRTNSLQRRTLERAERPLPLCNKCGELLVRNQCPSCRQETSGKKRSPQPPKPSQQPPLSSHDGEFEFWNLTE